MTPESTNSQEMQIRAPRGTSLGIHAVSQGFYWNAVNTFGPLSNWSAVHPVASWFARIAGALLVLIIFQKWRHFLLQSARWLYKLAVGDSNFPEDKSNDVV